MDNQCVYRPHSIRRSVRYASQEDAASRAFPRNLNAKCAKRPTAYITNPYQSSQNHDMKNRTPNEEGVANLPVSRLKELRKQKTSAEKERIKPKENHNEKLCGCWKITNE